MGRNRKKTNITAPRHTYTHTRTERTKKYSVLQFSCNLQRSLKTASHVGGRKRETPILFYFYFCVFRCFALCLCRGGGPQVSYILLVGAAKNRFDLSLLILRGEAEADWVRVCMCMSL
jgi:hypothetical protein